MSYSQEQLDEAVRKARREGADSVHMSKMFGADRIAFIREAAIALHAAALASMTWADCWSAAKALWDAKPEDC